MTSLDSFLAYVHRQVLDPVALSGYRDSFDDMKSLRCAQKKRQKSLWNTANRRVRKETRTDEESATFEMLELLRLFPF